MKKNFYTSAFIKIITYYKLNKYNTINNRIDTSAYYSILALACKELYYIAGGDFKDKDASIDNSVGENNPD